MSVTVEIKNESFYVGFEQVTGTNELLLTRKPWVSGAETTPPFLAGMASYTCGYILEKANK
jgi:hypothetical protein